MPRRPTASSTRRPRRRLLRRLLSARGRSLEITRSGALFILLTLAIGFAAINSGSNLLHAIFGAQMALIIGSGILSESTVRRARARRVAGTTVHAGTPAPVLVQLGNSDPRRELLSVSVEDDDRIDVGGRCAPVFAVRVPPGSTRTLTTTVTMPRRGRHRLPAAVIATRFPFGLFVKRRQLDAPEEVTVYPRIHPIALRPGSLERPGAGDAAGRAARVGEFFGLREYRDGDDARRIYWPALARLDKPVVRDHEAQGDRQIVVDLPPGISGEPGFEAEVERVASICVAHLQAPGVSVGVRYHGQLLIEPASGPRQRHRILEALACVGSDPGAPA